jgi:hypothetical protein
VISNKVIFLDIDGVLCTLRSHFAHQNRGGLNDAWDQTCALMIARLCKDNGAAIVISSSWRIMRRQILEYYLSMHSLCDYLYGEVRHGNLYSQQSEDFMTKRLDSDRGHEIADWLANHPNVNQYIILDDDADMLPEQMPFLIKCDPYEGFGAMNFCKAEDLLK